MPVIKYTELGWTPGQSNLPGIPRYALVISKNDIVGWPTLPTAVVAGMGTLVNYVGDFTLAANAKFQKINLIPEKSNIDGKSQGVKPSKTFLNQFVAQYPGTQDEASAYAYQANNDDLVYLVPENNSDKFRVFGNEKFETNTEVEQKLGGAPTDEMGTTITVTVTDIAPALFYAGEIITEDGTINPQA